ncbi:MAG: DUF72 domain-containing protein [Acidobacteriota bacterium]|nr:DUF72 domain-containing protein [Acidobacteriota bacterium]
MNIKIGTCGFRGRKEEYAEIFSCVEVQHTFYQPPQTKTLERWRALMPDDFEFTLKAWQLITHEAKSPTYRRLSKKLTKTEKAEAGYFKPTKIVHEAWEITLACAKALRAKTILFQCPASFKPYAENIENLNEFFSEIERENFNLAWEPRGVWDNKIIKEICERHNLWHVVDPLKRQTVTPDKCYFRLYGITGFRYKYEDDELEELVSLLPKNKLSYVFFNNIFMTEDALRFQNIINSL